MGGKRSKRVRRAAGIFSGTMHPILWIRPKRRGGKVG